MRVIAGSARRLTLATVPGLDTRPTTDRIKETLFNILMPYLPGCEFLDLFAGSGGIGIEALSRGAAHCVFVDNSRRAADCIERNLEHTHLREKGVLMRCDYLAAIDRLKRQGRTFDLIFMDPPYGKEAERQALAHLAGSCLVTEKTLIVVEAALDTDFSYVGASGFEIRRVKEYKTNKHVFLQTVSV